MKKVVLILWLLVLGNIGMKAEFSHIVRVDKKVNECPHVPKLAKFKPPRCPIGVYWNTLCLMRDVWTIKTYMI